jgi:hypothetical protein
MGEFAVRVSNGAWLLTKYFGPGWQESVDTEDFHMDQGDKCVLGQLFGSYFAGLRALGINADFFATVENAEAIEQRSLNGFTLSAGHPVEDWYALDREWKELIRSYKG